MEILIDNYSISPIHMKDAWRLCDFVVSNADRLKVYFPKTLQENLTPTLAELFVAKKEKQFGNNEEYLFTVKENENRTIIGIVYVKELGKESGQGELAYAIGYAYEGKGIMSKVVASIIQWSFNQARLNKLQIIVHETNLGSIRTAEKNHFTFQGILREEHKMPDGTRADMKLYERKKETENSFQ